MEQFRINFTYTNGEIRGSNPEKKKEKQPGAAAYKH